MTELIAKIAREGHRFFESKDFVNAFASYACIADARERTPFLADRYADCLLKLGRWAEARDAFLYSIEHHGLAIGRLCNLALCQIKLREYDVAAQWLGCYEHEESKSSRFFVFSAISAIGSGEVNVGLAFAKRAIASDATGESSNYLTGLLNEIGSLGAAQYVQTFVERLLSEAIATPSALRAGIRAASISAQWSRKLEFARALFDLERDNFDAHVYLIESLLDVRDYSACERRIAETNSVFPRSKDDRRLQGLSLRLRSAEIWETHLAMENSESDFASMNLRIIALFTLKRYEEAGDAALHYLRTIGEHPWMTNILGCAYEARGEFANAIACYARAAQEESHQKINYLLRLLRLQIRCGLDAEARATAAALAPLYPRVPATEALFATLGVPGADRLEISCQDCATAQTWLHGGDSGDVIYALAAMQRGGGGHLYLTTVPGTREPMTRSKISFLEPLLLSQPYVRGLSVWQGETVVKDFTLFRQNMARNIDLVTQQWRCVIGERAPDVTAAWLHLPDTPTHGRVVFARSSRYRNKAWNGLWKELKRVCPNAIFVGTQEEFQDFGGGEHYCTANALDLAKIIKGCSLFVGNQSFPYAIAEGLKVGRMLEVSPEVPNCVFPGAIAFEFPEN